MLKYYCATKKDDKNDCRLFFDKENAMAAVEKNPSRYFEVRCGRAVEYFKDGKLKCTVISGETFWDIISSDEMALLAGGPFEDVDVSFKDAVYVAINKKTFIMIDLKEEELS